MTSLFRLALLMPLAAAFARADIERTLEKAYVVAPGDLVAVSISGGSSSTPYFTTIKASPQMSATSAAKS